MRPLVAASAAAAVIAAVAGCGSTTAAVSSSSSSASSSASSNPPSSAQANWLKQAQNVTAAAEKSGVTAYPWETGTPAPVSIANWHGPKSVPALVHGKTIAIASNCGGGCAPTNATETQIANQWGWTVKVVNGDGTVTKGQQLMSAAIAAKPNAIIAQGIASATIGQQLTQAKSDGIVALGSATYPTGTQPDFDAFSGYPNALFERVAFDKMLADTDGRLHVPLVNTPTLQIYKPEAGIARAALAPCGKSCSLTVVNMAFADSLNPVTMGQDVSSALSANPNINYVYVPTDIMALSAVDSALRQLGRQGSVKIGTSTGTVPGIAATASGAVAFDVARPLDLTSYYEMADMRRLFAGEKPFPIEQTGDFVHVFTRAQASGLTTSPEIGDAMNRFFDYRAINTKVLGIHAQ